MISSVNENDAAAVVAARRHADVRGDQAVLPSPVAGRMVTADTVGGLGGHLGLCMGVGGLAPFDLSTTLYEYHPVGGACAP